MRTNISTFLWVKKSHQNINIQRHLQYSSTQTPFCPIRPEILFIGLLTHLLTSFEIGFCFPQISYIKVHLSVSEKFPSKYYEWILSVKHMGPHSRV